MDMWILKARGPYTKEIPSTRCTSLRLVGVEAYVRSDPGMVLSKKGGEDGVGLI